MARWREKKGARVRIRRRRDEKSSDAGTRNKRQKAQSDAARGNAGCCLVMGRRALRRDWPSSAHRLPLNPNWAPSALRVATRSGPASSLVLPPPSVLHPPHGLPMTTRHQTGATSLMATDSPHRSCC